MSEKLGSKDKKPDIAEIISIFIFVAIILSFVVFITTPSDYDIYRSRTIHSMYAIGTFEDFQRAIRKTNNYVLTNREITIDGVNMLLSKEEYDKYLLYMGIKKAPKNLIEKEW